MLVVVEIDITVRIAVFAGNFVVEDVAPLVGCCAGHPEEASEIEELGMSIPHSVVQSIELDY